MTDTTPEAPPQDERSEEEIFRDEQLAAARAQGLTGDNAVPERRPASFDQPAVDESDIAKRLRKAGDLNEEPMGKEAYDKADSDSQRREAADNSRSEAIMVGAAVQVTDKRSPHYERKGAVVRAVYSDEDAALKQAGLPEQRLLDPQEVEVRFRGGPADGQVVLIETNKLKLIPQNTLSMFT